MSLSFKLWVIRGFIFDEILRVQNIETVIKSFLIQMYQMMSYPAVGDDIDVSRDSDEYLWYSG